jgi:hypothetical protein
MRRRDVRCGFMILELHSARCGGLMAACVQLVAFVCRLDRDQSARQHGLMLFTRHDESNTSLRCQSHLV